MPLSALEPLFRKDPNATIAWLWIGLLATLLIVIYGNYRVALGKLSQEIAQLKTAEDSPETWAVNPENAKGYPTEAGSLLAGTAVRVNEDSANAEAARPEALLLAAEEELSRRIDRVRFYGNAGVYIGLVGTLAGLAIAANSVRPGDLTMEALPLFKKNVTDMMQGFSGAFYSAIGGVIITLFLNGRVGYYERQAASYLERMERLLRQHIIPKTRRLEVIERTESVLAETINRLFETAQTSFNKLIEELVFQYEKPRAQLLEASHSVGEEVRKLAPVGIELNAAASNANEAASTVKTTVNDLQVIPKLAEQVRELKTEVSSLKTSAKALHQAADAVKRLHDRLEDKAGIGVETVEEYTKVSDKLVKILDEMRDMNNAHAEKQTQALIGKLSQQVALSLKALQDTYDGRLAELSQAQSRKLNDHTQQIFRKIQEDHSGKAEAFKSGVDKLQQSVTGFEGSLKNYQEYLRDVSTLLHSSCLVVYLPSDSPGIVFDKEVVRSYAFRETVEPTGEEAPDDQAVQEDQPDQEKFEAILSNEESNPAPEPPKSEDPIEQEGTGPNGEANTDSSKAVVLEVPGEAPEGDSDEPKIGVN